MADPTQVKDCARFQDFSMEYNGNFFFNHHMNDDATYCMRIMSKQSARSAL